jgi:virulence-associated protein VagC
MSKQKFNEGLSRKSLEYLVQPVISIDEFESKISDKKCIVVGFYCGDADPARDLSNFIDRSSQPILDTEVSPAPTPDGFYVVWVEISRTKNFPQILINILEDVDNLTNVDQWQFQSPQQKSPADVNLENLNKSIELDQSKIIEPISEPTDDTTDDEQNSIEDKTDTDQEHEQDQDQDQDQDQEPESEEPESEESLKEFWINSNADSVMLEGRTVSFLKNNNIFSFYIADSIPENLDIRLESEQGRNLQRLLGPAYGVYAVNNGFIIENEQNLILLKPQA